MFKKIVWLVLVTFFFAMNANAQEFDSHTAKYKQCMESKNQDSILAKCMHEEYDYYIKLINDKVNEIENTPYFAEILNNKQYSLKDQYENWDKMTKLFCGYYVTIKGNKGYSDDYNLWYCSIKSAEDFEEWLSGTIDNAKTGYVY